MDETCSYFGVNGGGGRIKPGRGSEKAFGPELRKRKKGKSLTRSDESLWAELYNILCLWMNVIY